MASQLILVAVRGTFTQIVFGPALPAIIGIEKAKLIKSGNWKGFTFQSRTIEGYKAVKILSDKIRITKKETNVKTER